MPNQDEEIDAQMAADSTEYDQPAQVEPPPEKKGILSSVRERLGEMSAKAKEDRERREAEAESIKEAEKEAASRGEAERKEAEKQERAQKAYEKAKNKKPLFQTALGAAGKVASAAGRIGSASAGLTQRLQPSQPAQPQRQLPPTFGGLSANQPTYGYTQAREPNYGAAVGHSFSGMGVPLIPPQRPPQRMAKTQTLKMPPLVSHAPHLTRRQTHPSRGGGRSSSSSLPPLMGKVGKMPPLFGSMKRGKKRRGFF